MTDDFYDADEAWAGKLGPIFMASYESECASCPDSIQPGDATQADGQGGWIHATTRCQEWTKMTDEERHPGVKMRACSECFEMHMGECL